MASKTTQTKADEHITRSAQGLMKQVIYLVNTAPIITPVPDDDTPHRGNTPWLIFVPFLRICFLARNKNGEPICGFFDDGEAVARARKVIRECRSDPQMLADLQEDYRWPEDLGDEVKIMQRFVDIETAPEA